MIRNPLSTQQKQQLLQTQTALSTLEQLLFFKDNWAETYNIPDSPTLDLDKVEGLADYLSQAELQTISQQQVQQSVEQNVQQAIRSTQERVSPSTPSLTEEDVADMFIAPNLSVAPVNTPVTTSQALVGLPEGSIVYLDKDNVFVAWNKDGNRVFSKLEVNNNLITGNYTTEGFVSANLLLYAQSKSKPLKAYYIPSGDIKTKLGYWGGIWPSTWLKTVLQSASFQNQSQEFKLAEISPKLQIGMGQQISGLEEMKKVPSKSIFLNSYGDPFLLRNTTQPQDGSYVWAYEITANTAGGYSATIDMGALSSDLLGDDTFKYVGDKLPFLGTFNSQFEKSKFTNGYFIGKFLKDKIMDSQNGFSTNSSPQSIVDSLAESLNDLMVYYPIWTRPNFTNIWSIAINGYGGYSVIKRNDKYLLFYGKKGSGSQRWIPKGNLPQTGHATGSINLDSNYEFPSFNAIWPQLLKHFKHVINGISSSTNLYTFVSGWNVEVAGSVASVPSQLIEQQQDAWSTITLPNPQENSKNEVGVLIIIPKTQGKSFMLLFKDDIMDGCWNIPSKKQLLGDSIIATADSLLGDIIQSSQSKLEYSGVTLSTIRQEDDSQTVFSIPVYRIRLADARNLTFTDKIKYPTWVNTAEFDFDSVTNKVKWQPLICNDLTTEVDYATPDGDDVVLPLLQAWKAHVADLSVGGSPTQYNRIMVSATEDPRISSLLTPDNLERIQSREWLYFGGQPYTNIPPNTAWGFNQTPPIPQSDATLVRPVEYISNPSRPSYSGLKDTSSNIQFRYHFKGNPYLVKHERIKPFGSQIKMIEDYSGMRSYAAEAAWAYGTSQPTHKMIHDTAMLDGIGLPLRKINGSYRSNPSARLVVSRANMGQLGVATQIAEEINKSLGPVLTYSTSQSGLNASNSQENTDYLLQLGIPQNQISSILQKQTALRKSINLSIRKRYAAGGNDAESYHYGAFLRYLVLAKANQMWQPIIDPGNRTVYRGLLKSGNWWVGVLGKGSSIQPSEWTFKQLEFLKQHLPATVQGITPQNLNESSGKNLAIVATEWLKMQRTHEFGAVRISPDSFGDWTAMASSNLHTTVNTLVTQSNQVLAATSGEGLKSEYFRTPYQSRAKVTDGTILDPRLYDAKPNQLYPDFCNKPYSNLEGLWISYYSYMYGNKTMVGFSTNMSGVSGFAGANYYTSDSSSNTGKCNLRACTSDPRFVVAPAMVIAGNNPVAPSEREVLFIPTNNEPLVCQIVRAGKEAMTRTQVLAYQASRPPYRGGTKKYPQKELPPQGDFTYLLSNI